MAVYICILSLIAALAAAGTCGNAIATHVDFDIYMGLLLFIPIAIMGIKYAINPHDKTVGYLAWPVLIILILISIRLLARFIQGDGIIISTIISLCLIPVLVFTILILRTHRK